VIACNPSQPPATRIYADRVVEAVGLPRTFLQPTQAAARSGEVVFLGNIRGQFVVGQKDFSPRAAPTAAPASTQIYNSGYQ